MNVVGALSWTAGNWFLLGVGKMENVAPIERSVIRSMAEDSWRSLLAIDPTDQAALATAVERANAQVGAIAATMPQLQQDAFVLAFAEERQILINEQKHDPAGLRRRLGVVGPPLSSAEGIGTMAVKTAVRATIWTAIVALIFGR
jgi:hypothetical protein